MDVSASTHGLQASFGTSYGALRGIVHKLVLLGDAQPNAELSSLGDVASQHEEPLRELWYQCWRSCQGCSRQVLHSYLVDDLHLRDLDHPESCHVNLVDAQHV